MIIKLRNSDIETTYVDHKQILFVQSSPLGIRVGLDIRSTVPYILEAIDPIEEILEAIKTAQDNEYSFFPAQEGEICSG